MINWCFKVMPLKIELELGNTYSPFLAHLIDILPFYSRFAVFDRLRATEFELNENTEEPKMPLNI